MPFRFAAMLALLVLAGALLAPAAYAAPVVLAQAESGEGVEVENEGGSQSDAGTDTDQGSGDTSQGEDDLGQGGEGEPAAETGAGEDEQTAAEGEEGPQWTYQMSRLTLGMLGLLFLAMGGLYYKMIHSRTRA
jgi:cobalamin biosynthesis Mg chelatase CobN